MLNVKFCVRKSPVTVCKRVRDSHIYVTAGTEFPGNLLEETSGLILVAIATFLRHLSAHLCRR